MQREEINFFLQKVPVQELYALSGRIELENEVNIIQIPTQQTLLVPVKDPVTGGAFYGGEVLGTSTIVQVNGINGWALVMDKDIQRSKSIAVLDGAFAANIYKDEIVSLAEQGKQFFEINKKKINRKADDTRVSFDLM